jgi:hypothetical protein
MASKLPVDQMPQLEARVAFHKERQAFHAQQEIHHREQTAVHAAELAKAAERLEMFQAAAAAAAELLETPGAGAALPADPAVKETKDPEEDFGKSRPLSRMVARLVEEKRPDETFGPAAVTREVNQRWGAKLRRKADPAASLRSSAVARRRRSRLRAR